METKTINVLSKDELKNITAENVPFDVTTKAHMDKLKRDIKALTDELEKYKSLMVEVFGENGGNTLFTTESRTDYILDTDKLIEYIGKEKYESFKTKPSRKIFKNW